MSNTTPPPVERRRFRRRPILATFSLAVVAPSKGGFHRLEIHDLSDIGIGFDLDVEGEPTEFSLSPGDRMDLRFYVNQSLYFPLTVSIARVNERNGVRNVGAEFVKDTAGYKAFTAFLATLDAITDAVKIDPTGE